MLDAFYPFPPDGDVENGLAPATAVPAGAFSSDDHTELRHVVYESADGSITSGVWECAPMSMEIDAYSTTEVMTLISGRIRLTDEQGQTKSFGPGDTFLIPKGAKVTFEITETVRKFYLKAK